MSASGRSIKLGNDVSVAAQAELMLGAGRGADSLLAVFWGTGVGGGVAFEGELWHGRGDAGEIGHMVVKQGGARCGCGRRGCMEAYAGRRSMEAKAKRLVEKGHHTDLFEIMRERGRNTLSSGVWEHALHHKDKLAERLIERAVQALGSGVASAVNLLDVELVLVGGGLGSRFGEPMLERILRGDEAAPAQGRSSAGLAHGRASETSAGRSEPLCCASDAAQRRFAA